MNFTQPQQKRGRDGVIRLIRAYPAQRLELMLTNHRRKWKHDFASCLACQELEAEIKNVKAIR